MLGYMATRAQQSKGRRQTILLLLGVLFSAALLGVLEYAQVL